MFRVKMKDFALTIDSAMLLWFFNDYPYGAINRTDLFMQFHHFYNTKIYKNEKIHTHKTSHFDNSYKKFLNKFTNLDLIQAGRHHSRGYGYFKKAESKDTPQELICAIFPHSCINYLSAMQYYNITDRLPHTIQLTVINSKLWKEAALTKARSYYEAYPNQLIDIVKITPAYPQDDEYFGKQLTVSTTKNLPAFNTYENGLRIVDIGHLFVEMLRAPDLCGGLEHVFDVFTEHAETFLKAIINATNAGTLIDQARMGFMLDKYLQLHHTSIDEWKSKAKGLRGSSRVFLANADFANSIDLDWAISLNHYLVSDYGTEC